MMRLRIGAVLACCMASVASAEPLAPPPGPVADTGATQILSIPYTINQPGSYRLARDLTQEIPTPGIEILADDVILDLGGHVIDGKGSGTNGISILGSNVTVRNGVISNWNGSAIVGSGGPFTIEGVQMRDLAGNGIAMFSATVLVKDCNVVNCGTNGVAVGFDSVVENVTVQNSLSIGFAVDDNVSLVQCSAIDCSFDGFLVGSSCVLKRCSARLCEVGITVGTGCALSHCTAQNNEFRGIVTGANSILRGVIARDNGPIAVASSASADRGGIGDNDGIVTGDASVLVACLAEGNASRGIRVGDGCRVIDCMARLNFFGITAGDGSEISGCGAHENSGLGIFCGDGGAVRSSTANNNLGSGIVVNTESAVERCKVEENAGNGIEIRFTGCRIDSNHVAQNGASGIAALSVDNVIVRNVLELDNITDVGGSIIGPLNDITNPWTNFSL